MRPRRAGAWRADHRTALLDCPRALSENQRAEAIMNRIAVICIAIAGAMAGTSACAAETYPTKPVRMIVPSIAGGNADIQARYIAERLSEALGKQFVVDNRGGASGNNRHRARGALARGRLYGDARREHVHCGPLAFLEASVRLGQGFPADLAGRRDTLALHRQHGGRREQREGGDCAGEKPPRAVELRHDRHRLPVAPCGARCSS